MNARLTDSRGFGSTGACRRAQHFRIAGSRRPGPTEREKPKQVPGTVLVGIRRDPLKAVQRTLAERRHSHPGPGECVEAQIGVRWTWVAISLLAETPVYRTFIALTPCEVVPTARPVAPAPRAAAVTASRRPRCLDLPWLPVA
jgi:hypothetical protein